jgi:hypothetical protein
LQTRYSQIADRRVISAIRRVHVWEFVTGIIIGIRVSVFDARYGAKDAFRMEHVVLIKILITNFAFSKYDVRQKPQIFSHPLNV